MSEQASIVLACLGDAPAPPAMAADLALLLALPEGARRRLWEALGPSLSEPVPPEVESLLDGFCERYGADGDVLARVLKACRFLLREAGRRDAGREALTRDVQALCGPSAPAITAFLLAGFDAAKATVRAELLRAALVDHGKVLVGVSYRLDTVHASAEATNLEAKVALLTLRYRDGAREDRVTLQALPGVIRELRAACERILG